MDVTPRSNKVDPAFRSEVINGLLEAEPAIPARWLYDRRGSELFDAITRLAAYYPTRTETALLRAQMPEIARLVIPSCAVVEFGAGSATKTPILLRGICPKAYVPIDISGEHLRQSASALSAEFSTISIYPVEADFTKEVALPGVTDGLDRLGFFPGSTIGNFVPSSATDLLRHFRTVLGIGSKLLIGLDLVKSIDRLIAAYDDPEGVTAKFNLNLLRRINRELRADIPLDSFLHEARWNDMLGRIEMHLVATRDVKFSVEGKGFTLLTGQSIHTENSHKYELRGARLLLLAGGWTPVAEWTDEAEDFLLILAEAQYERFAP